MTYITKAGDIFDMIAYRELGSCKYVTALMNANRQFLSTLIFPAGVELTLPEIEPEEKTAKLPPWRT